MPKQTTNENKEIGKQTKKVRLLFMLECHFTSLNTISILGSRNLNLLKVTC